MTRQRKRKIDDVWKHGRVWIFFELCAKNNPTLDVFSNIEEYKGTALEIPLLAREYEEEETARKLGKILDSMDEATEYIQTFSDSMIDVFYQTGFDAMLYKFSERKDDRYHQS